MKKFLAVVTSMAMALRGRFHAVPVIHTVLRFHIPVPNPVIPGIFLY